MSRTVSAPESAENTSGTRASTTRAASHTAARRTRSDVRPAAIAPTAHVKGERRFLANMSGASSSAAATRRPATDVTP